MTPFCPGCGRGVGHGPKCPTSGGIALGPGSPLLEQGRPRAPKGDHEHEEQARLFAWADDPATRAAWPDLEMLAAVPNWFGKKTARQGARAKAEGRRAGYPDVLLDTPRGRFHGLRLELKAPGNTTSAAQGEWLLKLTRQGYFAVVCYGWEEARDTILGYLALRKPSPVDS